MNDFFEFDGFNDDLNFNTDSINFEKKSNFVVGAIAQGVGQVAGAVGSIAQASASKKVAQDQLTAIGGKRSAQLKDCERNKAFKKFLDANYRRNRIEECQDEVNKRMDAEEQEQKEIIKKMTNLEVRKIKSENKKIQSFSKQSESSKKWYVLGGILSLVLVLGTMIYLKKNRA